MERLPGWLSVREAASELVVQASGEKTAEYLAMAAVLDSGNHHAWASAPNPAEAHLVWETLRSF